MGNKVEMSAERQSLKKKLMSIILLEVSKPYQKMDCGLVDECIDFLMELEGKERLSKAEIKQRVNSIPFKGRVTALGSDVKKKIKAKRLALVAAVVALILIVFSIFTLASDTAFGDLLAKMGHSLMEIMDERTVEFDGVTMYNNDEIKRYKTVEELVKTEELDVLYPTWLPDEEKVVQVVHLREGEDESYVFQSNDSFLSVIVYIENNLHEDIISFGKSKRINNNVVYYTTDGMFVQGYMKYRNNVYTIGADTEENLFKIVENLKEIN